jgi:hypothetical protein
MKKVYKVNIHSNNKAGCRVYQYANLREAKRDVKGIEVFVGSIIECETYIRLLERKHIVEP